MPIYEYICADCEKTSEALRTMAQADEPIVCEHCASVKTHRAHSVFAAQSSGGIGEVDISACGRCGDPRGACGFDG